MTTPTVWQPFGLSWQPFSEVAIKKQRPAHSAGSLCSLCSLFEKHVTRTTQALYIKASHLKRAAKAASVASGLSQRGFFAGSLIQKAAMRLPAGRKGGLSWH